MIITFTLEIMFKLFKKNRKGTLDSFLWNDERNAFLFFKIWTINGMRSFFQNWKDERNAFLFFKIGTLNGGRNVFHFQQGTRPGTERVPVWGTAKALYLTCWRKLALFCLLWPILSMSRYYPQYREYQSTIFRIQIPIGQRKLIYIVVWHLLCSRK